MSNVFPPVLKTILQPQPEINNIIPLNLSSTIVYRFPKLNTPKILPDAKEVITYPSLMGVYDNKQAKKEAKKEAKKQAKKQAKKEAKKQAKKEAKRIAQQPNILNNVFGYLGNLFIPS
jgi:cbb3-type cytochrome oxidase cytochrome c subunit